VWADLKVDMMVVPKVDMKVESRVAKKAVLMVEL
jgi:hypothetical protein